MPLKGILNRTQKWVRRDATTLGFSEYLRALKCQEAPISKVMLCHGPSKDC